ncbi:NETI motif-containing protein [Bacillus massilinigeriensis]|uniref:NETI motif-containing protein n=1 Tax=Bacillus mediterraneensis TaxID=1805474 RepID=UPI0008F96DAD|nr:NETI motif-containing protein [Bacillus mediterraneensis]
MGKDTNVYHVRDGETIGDCLERMKKDGFVPVRRMEKPVFKEVMKDGKIAYEPAGREIIFEAKPEA